jgi:5-formyltetrahydrofolate cyclo-ligase
VYYRGVSQKTNNLKQALREKMISLRHSFSISKKKEASELICRFIENFTSDHNFSAIAGYFPLNDEVDILPALKRLHANNRSIFLPSIQPKETLLFKKVKQWSEMKKNIYGIQEPQTSEIISPQQLDLILVPGLAFDLHGNRLGFGKGYYDNFLSKISSHTLIMGVSFSFQVIEQVPTTSRDVPVQCVVSENGLFKSIS